MVKKIHRVSPVGEEKFYGGKDLPKSQVLRSEWKNKRVRKDASGNSEDGEEDDDELPCVIGESEGDCIWLGLQRWVGGSFHRKGTAYRKERLVIFREDWIGGWARAAWA